MDSYRTLKVSAGRHTFGPNQTIDLPADEAAALLGAGAIEPLHQPSPQVSVDEEPKAETKKRTRKDG